MTDAAEIRPAVRRFILENFLYSDNGTELNDKVSLIDKGVIDSTGILELLEFLEARFEINIQDEEVIPDNMDTVDNLVRFIDIKVKGN